MDARVSAAPSPQIASPRARWWREKECWFLVVLVIGVYFTRPTALSLRGEESRWANVAREMLQTGDYVVPRQQGEVFANRPPLNNWFLALSMTLTGRHDEWAVRLPTMLATLLTVLVIYAAGRALLSRTGALVGALSYATMGQVLQLGRHAESEAVLTLFVAASLLGWLVGYVRQWPAWLTWSVGYGFAALAGLAKGPQGPAYTIGTMWVFCLLFDRRLLFHRAHLIGIGLFTLITAVWQVPLMYRVGLEDALGIWLSEAKYRLAVYIPLKDRLVHLGKFPWIALGCMLPWSGLLVGFCDRAVRKHLGDLRRPAQFLGLAMLIGILPLLASVFARGRYYMPLYPCAALLVGIVVEISLSPVAGWRTSRAWRWFLVVSAACAPAAAIFIASASYVPGWSQGPYAQTTTTVVVFALFAAITAWFCREALARYTRRNTYLAACSVAVFCGLAYTVVIINAYQRRSGDPHADIAKVVNQIPADAKFVSFTTIHHLFAYYVADVSGKSIERADPYSVGRVPSAPLPAGQSQPGEWEYFCFNTWEPPTEPWPFRWELLGTVSIERNKRSQPVDSVVIGRRLPTGAPISAREGSFPAMFTAAAPGAGQVR
ncbi:MAG: glycosyltransferase family 39 protein [Pirellulales bacterium]